MNLDNVVIKKIGHERVVTASTLPAAAKIALQNGLQLISSSGGIVFFAKKSSSGRWYYKARLANKKLFKWAK